ncbi:MAG: hypothetical protein WAO32_00115 [Defluviitoga tunisiensis]
MARKSKLTKELIKEAYKLVAAGNYDKDVYPILGIDKSTWYRWLSDGEKAKSGLKREFYDTVKKAEKDAIARNVALIQRAAQEGNWQAAAWWLERKYFEDWGRKDKLDLSADKDGFKIVVEYADGDKNND